LYNEKGIIAAGDVFHCLMTPIYNISYSYKMICFPLREKGEIRRVNLTKALPIALLNPI